MGLHFKPQYQFLCTKKLEIEVDYVGYFENIESDYEHIQSRLNIEKKLGIKNANRTGYDYRHYYNERSKAIVEEVYREDIELLGYDFESTSVKGYLT